MKLKLGFRIALLTGMLFMLIATYKTQPAGACSPGWFEGCVSSCDTAYRNCDPIFPYYCWWKHEDCVMNCESKLQACNN